MMDRYTYRVMWSEEDEEYVGLCAEFSLLSHLADTRRRLLPVSATWWPSAWMTCARGALRSPSRFSTRRYSGTLTVRIPPESHRALALDAAEAGVSMNRLAAERLSLRQR